MLHGGWSGADARHCGGSERGHCARHAHQTSPQDPRLQHPVSLNYTAFINYTPVIARSIYYSKLSLFNVLEGLFSVQLISFLIRFSGIKASDLENVEHTLEDAQRAVSRLISWDCFIVGHSLESDLHALKVGVATVTCHYDAVTCPLSCVELLIIT